MRQLFGLVMAGGIVLASAAAANAQVSVSIGNPFTGTGVTIGNPYGAYSSGYGINGYGNPYYGAAYPGYGTYSSYYAAPVAGVTSYSSGYSSAIVPGSSWYGSNFAPAGPIVSSIYPYTAPAYGYSSFGYAPSYGFAPGYGYGYGTILRPRGLIRGWRW